MKKMKQTSELDLILATEKTGTTTLRAHLDKMHQAVQKAIQEDPRFDKDAHGYPEGSEQDKMNEPWVVDILTPDEEDGSHSAVIHTDDGKTVRHGFDYDEESGEATMHKGDPQETECTPVYSTAIEEHDEAVKAGAPMGNQNARKGLSEGTKGFGKKSERAEKWTKKAETNPTEESLNRAADAHSEAAYEHEMKSFRSKSASEADDHTTAAEYHDIESERLSKMAATKASDKSLSDSVHASGSSDGAQKGNASKKTDKANEASQSAHEASMKAHESGEDDDHNEAADQHEEAALAHKKAMLAHAKAGNSEQASEHAKMMTAHDANAAAHRKGETPVEAKMAAEFKNVVTCRDNGAAIKESKPWAMDTEVEFMYLPAGIHTITAGFRDKAIKLTVEVDESTAQTVQASFDNLLATTPKQKPFGCIEHDERDASVWANRFFWNGEESGDHGVYLAAEPSARGVEHVNGKIHRSWSPSFTTDADYAKAKEKDGVLYFPEGARGSVTNPARVTGIAPCVGTLTNKPAFKAIAPVRAKEGGTGTLTSAEVMEELKAKRQETDAVFAEIKAKQFPVEEENLTTEQVLAQLRQTGSPHLNNK